MKTYQIKKLLAVAAIAFLPIACGTTSPTGPDVAASETASALRIEPLPPSVPEVPSPEAVPEPAPSPKPDPTSVELPASVPAPADRSGNRPAPQPDPGVDPSPNDPAPPSTGTPTGTPTSDPAEPTTGGQTGGTPLPPTGEGVECLAVSVEVKSLLTFATTDGVSLEATLRGKDGVAITDGSCEMVIWEAEGVSAGSRIVITYGATSRFVTLTGLVAGTYKVGATTPNGQTGSLVLDVK